MKRQSSDSVSQLGPKTLWNKRMAMGADNKHNHFATCVSTVYVILQDRTLKNTEKKHQEGVADRRC